MYILALATERKPTIKYIFETHFHADFVSGHVDLVKLPMPRSYTDREQIQNFRYILQRMEKHLKLVHLPLKFYIHRDIHWNQPVICLKDENGKDHCVFTGDTLFVGDVGRPDLAQKMDEITTKILQE